ncbi:hypothetical protein [Deinococcus sp. PEB2-63]
MTVSVGGASWASVPLRQLVQRADEALYAAKHSGRNQARVRGIWSPAQGGDPAPRTVLRRPQP